MDENERFSEAELCRMDTFSREYHVKLLVSALRAAYAKIDSLEAEADEITDAYIDARLGR